jgi:hypothetical protein
MLPLHDHTRRRIAIALFFTLCLAPTVGVWAWCLSKRLPNHLQSEADRLSWQLGVKVELDAVRYPRPGAAVYEGVRLSNPETGQRIAVFREIETHWSTLAEVEKDETESRLAAERRGDKSANQGEPSKSPSDKPVLVVHVDQAAVEVSQWDELAKFVERAVTCRLGNAALDIHGVSDEVRWTQKGNLLSMGSLRGWIKHSAGGALAELAFRSADATTDAWSKLCVTRDRSRAPAANGFELTVPDEFPLPCALLAVAAPPMTGLGPKATFAGRLNGWQTSDGWAYRLTKCRFGEVELRSVAAQWLSGHKLDGKALVLLKEATLSSGRIQWIDGILQARHGRIGLPLVSKAVELGLQPGNNVLQPGNFSIDYDQLGAAFRFDSHGLQISRLEGSDGRLIAVGGEPILSESGQPIAAGVLAMAFAASGSDRSLRSIAPSRSIQRLPDPTVAGNDGDNAHTGSDDNGAFRETRRRAGSDDPR